MDKPHELISWFHQNRTLLLLFVTGILRLEYNMQKLHPIGGDGEWRIEKVRADVNSAKEYMRYVEWTRARCVLTEIIQRGASR